MSTYLNPYSGLTFFQTLFLFFQRLILFLTGQISLSEMASDEVQIAVLSSVAISGAIVGTFLLARRMTMLANSLSHTILVGIVVVYFFSGESFFEDGGTTRLPLMLTAAVVMAFITTFLTHFLSRVIHLQEDASTGLVFTTFFAIGIILVTLLTRSAHIGTEIVMGNVDALHMDDLQFILFVLLINICLIVLLYKEFLITTFDPLLASSLGISTLFFDYLLMGQTALTSIGGFRAVGVLMVLVFFTGPPLLARLFVNKISNLILLASGIGVLSSLLGVAYSRHLLSIYDLPISTGGVTVCTVFIFYILGAIISLRKKSIQLED